MTEALVTREALWYGDLPPVCVKTGQPADTTVGVSFERLPPWTFLLLLAGIFPFFIAAMFVRERVRGTVPITAVAMERYRAHKRWLWVGWALAVTGVLLMVLLTEPWMLLVTGTGVAVLLVTELRRSNDWISGVPVRGTPFVELRRVHPTFADAVAHTRA